MLPSTKMGNSYFFSPTLKNALHLVMRALVIKHGFHFVKPMNQKISHEHLLVTLKIIVSAAM